MGLREGGRTVDRHLTVHFALARSIADQVHLLGLDPVQNLEAGLVQSLAGLLEGLVLCQCCWVMHLARLAACSLLALTRDKVLGRSGVIRLAVCHSFHTLTTNKGQRSQGPLRCILRPQGYWWRLWFYVAGQVSCQWIASPPEHLFQLQMVCILQNLWNIKHIIFWFHMRIIRRITSQG